MPANQQPQSTSREEVELIESITWVKERHESHAVILAGVDIERGTFVNKSSNREHCVDGRTRPWLVSGWFHVKPKVGLGHVDQQKTPDGVSQKTINIDIGQPD